MITRQDVIAELRRLISQNESHQAATVKQIGLHAFNKRIAIYTKAIELIDQAGLDMFTNQAIQ